MITVETIINNVSYTIEFSDIPTLSITQAVAAANTATAAMSIVETKRVEVENTAVIVQENSAAAAQDRQTTQALRNETEVFKNTAVNAANQAIEYVATNEYVTRAGAQGIIGGKVFATMQTFYAPVLQGLDADNSPITIRERGAALVQTGADWEAPNLNLHWGNRGYKSMWMDAGLRIKFGHLSRASQTPDATLMFKKLILNSNVDTGHELQVGGTAFIRDAIGVGTSNPSNPVHVNAQFPVVRLEKTGVLSWIVGNITGNDYLIANDVVGNIAKIDVAGQTIFNYAVSAPSFIQTSSLRYKQDVETLENALDTVLSMRGVSYVRKDNGEKEIGFIAEEVHELLPDVVVLNKEQQPDAIAYSRIIPVLVEAMKQQQEQIDELKNKQAQIDELKKQDELRSKEIQDLKNIVNYLKTKL